VNAILLGATGMVGQGVLRECLLDPEAEASSSLGAVPPDNSTVNCTKTYTTTSLISP